MPLDSPTAQKGLSGSCPAAARVAPGPLSTAAVPDGETVAAAGRSLVRRGHRDAREDDDPATDGQQRRGLRQQEKGE